MVPSSRLISFKFINGIFCRFGGQPLNLDSLQKLIDKAFTPKKLEAVFLSINSPGGSPVQSELIVSDEKYS